MSWQPINPLISSTISSAWKDLKDCFLEEAVDVCGGTRGIARQKDLVVSAWPSGLSHTLLDLMHNYPEGPGSNPGAGKANQTFHPSGVDKLVAADILR